MSIIQISSPMPDVIRVQVSHYRGARKRGPEFELCITDEMPVETCDGDAEATLSSGTLTAHIKRQGGFSLRLAEAAQWPMCEATMGRHA